MDDLKDLISRAALLDEFRSMCGPQTGDGWDNMGVRNLIMRQKAVDAVPIIRDKWEEHRTTIRGYSKVWYQHCTPQLFESPYFYCPTCGARMLNKDD